MSVSMSSTKTQGSSLSTQMRIRAGVESPSRAPRLPALSSPVRHSASMPSLPGLSGPSPLSVTKGAKFQVKNQFDRLSGLYDIGDSSPFSDPSFVPKPTTLCVRCANHASVCMPCTETLCEESLQFYRETRARGAANLFQGAVSEAGMSKVLKFTMFRLWKNGCKQRVLNVYKKKSMAERLFGVNIVANPFRAWRQYARETKISRRDRRIEELSAKVQSLETLVLKLNDDCSSLSAEIDTLKEERSALNATISAHNKTIHTLHETVEVERHRVIGLSSLAEAVQVLSSVLDDVKTRVQGMVRAQLLDDTAACHEVDHIMLNYPDRGFDELYGRAGVLIEDADEDGPEEVESRLVQKKRIVRMDSDGDNADPRNETAENMTRRLIHSFVQQKSLDLTVRVEPLHGNAVDDYLPSHKHVDNYPGAVVDFSDGVLICRLVVALILDKMEDEKNSHSLLTPLKIPIPNTQVPKDRDSSVTENRRHLEMDDFEEIRLHRKSSPLTMVAYIVKLAYRCLATPLFDFHDISAGDPNVTYAFLSHLILSSAPSKPMAVAVEVGHYTASYDTIEHHAEQTRQKSRVTMSRLFRLQSQWADVMHKQVVTGIVLPPSEEFKKSMKQAQAASFRGNADAIAALQDDEDYGQLTARAARSEASAEQSEKEVVVLSHAEMYKQLGAAVDNYLLTTAEEVRRAAERAPVHRKRSSAKSTSSGGDGEDVMDEDHDLLNIIQVMGRDVMAMFKLRNVVHQWQVKRHCGMRLATDCLRTISSQLIWNLTGRLNWLKDDVDEKLRNKKAAQKRVVISQKLGLMHTRL